MAVFECSDVRGRLLELVYSFAVNTPTSVEAERAFSAAMGYFAPRFVHISMMRHWIVRASCAAIIASVFSSLASSINVA